MARLDCLLLVVLCQCGSVQLEYADGEYAIPLYHSYSRISGETAKFSERGTITISVSKFGLTTRYSEYQELTTEQKNGLEESAKDPEAIYRVKVPSSYGPHDNFNLENDYVMSFIKSCLLVESDLSDVITLTIDSSNQRILSVTVHPISSAPTCDPNGPTKVTSTHFNTTVAVIDVIEGPSPETQAYLQKLEKDRQQKEQGEQGDNRSFLAKYWMYIVPVVIFVMVSGAFNQDGQGR